MGMGCSQVHLLLSAYLDEMTDPEETREVKTHLESCLDCREKLSQLHRMCLILRKLDNPKAPRRLWKDIKKRLD